MTLLRKRASGMKSSSAMFLTMALISGSMLLGNCKAKEQILVDGSSTVYPITSAVAEEFGKVDSSVNVTVGVSGTGGGFKKFCNKETQISDASRPIKSKEVEACEKGGVEYIELEVAYDGLAVIVNPENDFVNSLTVEQLNHIFRYENPAKTWKEVNAAWPDMEITIYSPGQDSGTYDYFVEEVIGKKGRVRADATFSEDDNVLVTGVSGDKGGIGFFGLAYYEENKDKLKLVPVVNPELGKAIAPDLETVKNGTYAPLSRPLFIYVNKDAAGKPVIEKFIKFYIENAGKLAKDVGYIPLPAESYKKAMERFEARETGSAFHK